MYNNPWNCRILTYIYWQVVFQVTNLHHCFIDYGFVCAAIHADTEEIPILKCLHYSLLYFFNHKLNKIPALHWITICMPNRYTIVFLKSHQVCKISQRALSLHQVIRISKEFFHLLLLGLLINVLLFRLSMCSMSRFWILMLSRRLVLLEDINLHRRTALRKT